MTRGDRQHSFGPYAFTLTPTEAEAAAERLGLRTALKGGPTARHHAGSLVLFALTLLIATTLALTGLIGRRAAEATIIFVAAAFMIHRAATRRRMRRARRQGNAAVARLQSAGVLAAAFDHSGLWFEFAGCTSRLDYADCEEAEDAGGLLYIWPSEGMPVVVPSRALADADEAKRLVAQLDGWIRRSRQGRRAKR